MRAKSPPRIKDSKECEEALQRTSRILSENIRRLNKPLYGTQQKLAEVTGHRPNTIGKLFNHDRAAKVQVAVLQSVLLALQTDWTTIFTSPEAHVPEPSPAAAVHAAEIGASLDGLLYAVEHFRSALRREAELLRHESGRSAVPAGEPSPADDQHHPPHRHRSTGTR